MSSGAVKGTTRVIGLIGLPVEHTMSPAMHNAAFRALGLDYVYVPFPVDPLDLPDALNGLRALNVRGFNVTMPHKSACIPHLDGLDALAESLGAVNTVVNTDGELRGYNTDADGFFRSLKTRGIEVAQRRVVIIGAGGAARAVAYILAREGARLALVNRTAGPAQEIAATIEEDFEVRVPTYPLDDTSLQAVLTDAAILVNTTSVGMGASNATPVPAGLLRPDLTVCDVVYNPVRTRLLEEAEAAGATTVSGVDMLVWQGALSFHLWTGEEAPFDLMRDTVLGLLREA